MVWQRILVLSLVLLGGCGGAGNGGERPPGGDDGGGGAFAGIVLTRVQAGFIQPLAYVAGPGGAMYAVEQAGRVQRVVAGQAPAVFADIRQRVASGGERGLLGLAFDPRFADNGRVYLSYTREGDAGLQSVLARFVSPDGGLGLDADSEEILLTVDQPYGNHNGGQIAFGPDGYLYFGLGDGGSGGDPQGHGQDVNTLLGAMLRLDVSGGSGYAIPADNPFAQGGGRPEIFAWGLRNPWRWSFDRGTGELWLADVGQNLWEEIDLVRRGGNYGWNVREGAHCYGATACDATGLIDPLYEYGHDQGCSVTGGYVYRGRAIAGLEGAYLYGDFCSGKIWALFADGRGGYENRLLLDSSRSIASFGEDAEGELYVVDIADGGIYRIDPAPAS